MMGRVPTFERTPPDHVVRGLRALDPAAELVYMGYGKWYLGRFVSDRRIYESGVRLKASTLRAIENAPPPPAAPAAEAKSATE